MAEEILFGFPPPALSGSGSTVGLSPSQPFSELPRKIFNRHYNVGNLLVYLSSTIANFSRNTIRGVLTEPEQEGIISRKDGKGIFVNPEALALKVALIPAIAFGHIINLCGIKPNYGINRFPCCLIDAVIVERRTNEVIL